MTQPFDAHRLSTTAVSVHGACQDTYELEILLNRLWWRGWPDWVLEIGSDRGGTLWLWQQLARLVVSVTLHTRADGMFNAHGVVVIEGDSKDPVVQDTVRALLPAGSHGLVFIDGGHDEETVRSDLALALELVERGTVVVHDIAAHLYGQSPDVGAVWDDVKAGRRYIEIVAIPGKTPGYGILRMDG